MDDLGEVLRATIGALLGRLVAYWLLRRSGQSDREKG